MDGQITLFNLETDFLDETIDKRGISRKPPEWMKYKRCENCTRWQRLDSREQPPDGWGIYGFCMEHKTRCATGSYCNEFDDKRKI